ncbi:MAG: hypothetical protein A2X86_08930 [Bdellovibrionales bacterium GWA2_49_15]|nr:MAG: hypothetical protein A2X86_08930 [Bdellovibrionales bacterium GWA2_49_15]HAZ12901.1 hypothetical protein [Bdellovibrionales bacterium]
MKLLLQLFLILIVILPTVSRSELYLAAMGGTSKLASDNPELDSAFKGQSYGFMAGYQLISLFALEMGYKQNHVKGTVRARVFNSSALANDQVSVDMKSNITMFGLRLTFFTFVNIFGGYASHALDTTVKINNTDVSNNREYDSLQGSDGGAYYGLGARLPLMKFDLFGEVSAFQLTSTAFIDAQVGLRVRF